MCSIRYRLVVIYIWYRCCNTLGLRYCFKICASWRNWWWSWRSRKDAFTCTYFGAASKFSKGVSLITWSLRASAQTSPSCLGGLYHPQTLNPSSSLTAPTTSFTVWLNKGIKCRHVTFQTSGVGSKDGEVRDTLQFCYWWWAVHIFRNLPWNSSTLGIPIPSRFL